MVFAENVAKTFNSSTFPLNMAADEVIVFLPLVPLTFRAAVPPTPLGPETQRNSAHLDLLNPLEVGRFGDKQSFSNSSQPVVINSNSVLIV